MLAPLTGHHRSVPGARVRCDGGGSTSLEDDLLLKPPRSRRPPLLSRLPVWVWILFLCAFIGWLVYRLRHAIF